ncbi:MAG TPA: HK97 gp10 family phage protein [Caldilineae bacterium]|nr:HK97 gp10 family phage protein [Caldilineae bacterium]
MARGRAASKIRRIINKARRRALMDVGRYVRAQAAKYPPQKPTTTYRRTGTLGRSIAVEDRVRRSGNRYWIEVGTNVPYARFVEYGTGLYGPEKRLIEPKSAKALAWEVPGAALGKLGGRQTVLIAYGIARRKGKLVRSQKHDVHMVFAHHVRGFEGWHFMRKAFMSRTTRRYFRARLIQMLEEIKRDLSVI